MDKEIPKEYRVRQRRIRIMKWTLALVATVCLIVAAAMLMGKGVKASDLRLCEADRGTIETTVNASGKVAPAFEEIITSPIDTKILEVYRQAGDSVDEGTPLISLDLLSAETELKRLEDERRMKHLELEKLRLNNVTFLTNLDMQIKVKAKSVNRLSAELANELRLDSLGSGTGDRVEEVRLAYETACLELDQLRKDLVNERGVRHADEGMKELELAIAERKFAENTRMFEDAQIRSPRKATLTYIVDHIGQKVARGEKVAVIADLSRFRVEGEIADTYGERVEVGSRAVVRLGRESLGGVITNVIPGSQGGVISFSVRLEDDNHPKLRSGLRTDVYVMCDVRDDVVRIANGPYYTGPGSYDLFVATSPDMVEKRKVVLGGSNYEYVEVVEGISPGEMVVTADMSAYRDNNKLKIK